MTRPRCVSSSRFAPNPRRVDLRAIPSILSAARRVEVRRDAKRGAGDAEEILFARVSASALVRLEERASKANRVELPDGVAELLSEGFAHRPMASRRGRSESRYSRGLVGNPSER